MFLKFVCKFIIELNNWNLEQLIMASLNDKQSSNIDSSNAEGALIKFYQERAVPDLGKLLGFTLACTIHLFVF